MENPSRLAAGTADDAEEASWRSRAAACARLMTSAEWRLMGRLDLDTSTPPSRMIPH
jgi:hypothetical protein